jgi:hypothetical protein
MPQCAPEPFDLCAQALSNTEIRQFYPIQPCMSKKVLPQPHIQNRQPTLTTSPEMPKRKREDGPADSSSSKSAAKPSASTDRTLARQKQLTTARLATASTDLLSALRFSAGFERQKYSRRKKTAKTFNDAKAVARLDTEYAVLKGLDFAKVAEQHLRKTVGRVKSIKDAEALYEWLGELERGDQDPVALNVLARLYNGAGVKKVVNKVVDDLKEILGVGGVGLRPGKEVEVKKAKVRDVQMQDGEGVEDVSDGDGDAFGAFNARIAAPSSVEGDSDVSLSEGDRPPSIAEDSEGEGEGDSEDNSDDIAVDIKMGSDSSNNSDSDHDSSSETPNSAVINSPALDPVSSASDTEPAPAPKPKKATAPKEPISKSTFLPSLSHAAYYSGSESEAEDLDIDLAPRKNRRGQKARQKIWEKKYGEKAKHKEKEDRNKGWDAKRGAVDSGERKGRGRGRVPEVSGENAMPLGGEKKMDKEKKRDDVGVLHPSWLAAKAAKEKKAATVKPLGKKITFD